MFNYHGGAYPVLPVKIPVFSRDTPSKRVTRESYALGVASGNTAMSVVQGVSIVRAASTVQGVSAMRE